MAWGFFKKIGDGIKKGWNSVIKPALGKIVNVAKPIVNAAGGILDKVKPGLGSAIKTGVNIADGLLNKPKNVKFNPISDDDDL